MRTAANAMHPTSRRRYFRFSLRTMFLVLTVFSMWLGYEANWIRQRRSALENQNLAYFIKDRVRAPGLLWLFGETGYPRLVVAIDRNGDKSEVQRVKRLFPEADIETIYSWP